MAFNNAHHFSMENATFNTHVHQHPPPLATKPAHILHLARAVGASHKSSAATYATKCHPDTRKEVIPTRCHPDTRKEVIADIVDWVIGGAGTDEDSSPCKSILWFSGPAGAGNGRPFIATVVHHLTVSRPDLKKAVLDIIRGHPTIFEESLDSQMDRLLVRPFQSSTFLLPASHKIVIAVDGLDECTEEHEREHLVNLLRTLVTALPRLFVVVVASRPEFDLRRIFNKPRLSIIAKLVQLQDYDGTKDIWIFLCDEFEEIRQSDPLRMLIPEGWPFENLVQLLVDKSSSNFILPSTAAKYIKSSRRNPVESLNIIVGLLEKPPADTSKPFAELDALYSHILHPPEADAGLIKRILHCLLGIGAATKGYSRYQSPSFLDEFLSFSPGTTTTTLCDLHSILSVPDSEYGPIKFHHKSMEDYLLDPERSGDLFQSPYDTQVDITIVCTMRLTRWDANPFVDSSLSLGYTCIHWNDHFKQCIDHKPISATFPDIILNMDPRMWMKYRFVHGYSLHFPHGLLSNSIHAALCSTRYCVRVCQLLSRANDCLGRFNALSTSFGPFDYDKKLEALPRFTSETGLYEPLHPNSRTVFHAWNDRRLHSPPTSDLAGSLSPPDPLRNPAIPDLPQSPPAPDFLQNPPTPDLFQNAPTPDLPINPSVPSLPPTPPAPNPSFLPRLGGRIMRRLTALRQKR